MDLNAYRLIDPAPASQADQAINELLDNEAFGRLTRMCKAIDRFIQDPEEQAYRTAPGDPERRSAPQAGIHVEVYVVPRIYEEAAAVLHVNHGTRTIKYLAVYSSFGAAPEKVQWDEILKISSKGLQ